jgi:uncharacterized protein (TIGR03437 family)
VRRRYRRIRPRGGILHNVPTVVQHRPFSAFCLLAVAAVTASAQTGVLQFNINTNIGIAIGVPVTIRWTVSGGVPPYQTVLLNPEALPIGLSFNASDFEITGTPTLLGTYPISLAATDAQGNAGSAAVTITVGPPLSVSTATLPPATQGQPYAYQLAAAGGGPPYTWSFAGGTLPPGFRMDTRGIVGGVASGSGTFIFSVKVIDSQGSVATQNLTIQVTTPTPVITVSSVVNAASSRPGLAPGSYASIYGSNLAASSAGTSGFPLPQTLGSVNVTLNGAPVPLLSVSPAQINFQVPFSIAPGKATLVVNSAGTPAPAMQVDIVAAAPGTFQTADGRALALNEDGSVNSPSRPDRSGSILVLFATGAGAFNSSLTTGGTSPSGTLIQIAPLPAVTIGGKAAEILYAGAAPGQASGLFQINVRIPTLSPSGDYPVVVVINGQTSQPVVVSIAAQQ